MSRPSLKPLATQVVVITGASSGIGLLTARRAAVRGAKVVLVSRNADALSAIVDEIAVAGGTAVAAPADVGNLVEVRAAARIAIDRFGRIDTWINNAGVAIYARLVDTPEDEHRRLFQTNYFGVVHGCLTAVAHLREAGGAIITIGSIASDIPSPVLGAYAASKHAIKAYVETLRMEIHADGAPIAVTLIKPSGIDTPIAQHAADHGPGKARVPPPVYDPALVVDAILHAAEHPRRDITIGGLGRLNVLIGQHFPWVIDAVTPTMRRLLYDCAAPAPASSTLFSVGDARRERSGEEAARRASLYTRAELHPLKAVGGAIAIAAMVGLGWRRWRKAGVE